MKEEVLGHVLYLHAAEKVYQTKATLINILCTECFVFQTAG